MNKREFVEQIIIRCSNMTGAKPYYLTRYALECWEHLEKYGTSESAAMPIDVPQGVTGPRNPGNVS